MKKTAIEAVDEALKDLVIMGVGVPSYSFNAVARELPAAIDAAIEAIDGDAQWEADTSMSTS
jgi:hypothetical protein